MNRIVLTIILVILLPLSYFGQGKPYAGPEDPAADISEMRSGHMNGNRAILYFENSPYLGDMGRGGSRISKWPNTYEGLLMVDHIFLMIGAEVYVHQDSIPITDEAEIERLDGLGELDTLYFLQSHGSSWYVDKNYHNTVHWQFYPVHGYFNETQDYPAMSNKPDSWPVEGWPSTGFDKKWDGEWNGRFGRGVQYADLETYFVANDAQDLENIVIRNDPEENLITEGPRYYPRPGRFIGDIRPATVQNEFPWGGLGLRTAVRGFQWNNPEAKDMIFWEYDISNISDYDLPKCGFGYYIDARVGGDDEDNGYFNKELDMAYIWDWDGFGTGGFTPGVLGVAYLESPGKPYDGEDNDEDGLLDEKRDNQAGALIGPTDGIHDLQAFRDYYKLKEEDLREHFEGDEDQDWQDGVDLNGDENYSYYDDFNQVWLIDEGETTGDDVGLDGVGPMDLNYNGPDEGECNHRPDFEEGIGCEPNFAVTDISESDMIGLTSFYFFEHSSIPTTGWWPKDDLRMWTQMDSHQFNEYEGDPVTLFFSFASTSFPFYKGRTERISMGLLHAYEDLAVLSGTGHKAPNLYILKQTAQIIYEADYRFAQPPEMPTLRAVAADGKVYLSWDNVADQLTREPFIGNVNDFEGYKLYKATDKLFSDPEIVTNSQGVKMFKKPIYQCDLVDSLEGHVYFGAVGGVGFYLGNNSGIRHYYVDEEVQNGRTYYYALAAYDYGAPNVGVGISPTENNIVIELDNAEEIIRTGINVAVATPYQKAAGYQDPFIAVNNTNTFGNADITPLVYNHEEIKPGHTYKMKFNVDTLGHIKRNLNERYPMDIVLVNNGLSVYDVTEGNRKVYSESTLSYPLDNIIERNDRNIKYLMGQTEEINSKFYRYQEILTDNFDGIQLTLSGVNNFMPLEKGQAIPENGINEENTGWMIGNSDINIVTSGFEYYGFPYEYNIVFTDNDSAYVNRLNKKTGIRSIPGGTTNYLFDQAFSFYVTNQTALELTGVLDTMELVVEDVNNNGEFDMVDDRVLVGGTAIQTYGTNQLVSWGGTIFAIDFLSLEDSSGLPKPGDIYKFDFNRAFSAEDSIMFTVNGAVDVVEKDLSFTMEDIKVVPNPYVMSNSMEPAVGNKFLNQRRRILFTHIPAQCVIKIYTSSGVLVDKIEVDNEASNGTVHWDLLSKEDLEVAAGMYIYHIKSSETGDEKIGKFAVIK